MFKLNHQKCQILFPIFLIGLLVTSFAIPSYANDSEPKAACVIDSMTVDVLDCTPNEVFWVVLDFVHDGDGTSFTLTGNGNNYGTYNYSDLPIELGPFTGDSTTVYELVATDTQDADCSDFVEFGPNTCECEVIDLVIETYECTDANLMDLEFSFEANNSGNDLWEAWMNDVYLGAYQYNADNNYTLSQVSVTENQDNIFTICVNDNADCCTEINFAPICPGPCSITDLSVDPLPCTPNGVYDVEVDLTNVGPGTHFTLQGNGNFYGTFAYEDLPVQIGPFTGDTGDIFELVATDLELTDCSDFVEFESQICDPSLCDIGLLEIEVFECLGTNAVDVEFVMFVDNPGNDLWEAWAGDIYLGSYPLNPDNYYSLSQVPVTAGQETTIEVCINDNPNCCSSFSFIANCNTLACVIDGMVVEPLGCDPGSNSYNVLVDLLHEGSGTEFNLTGNGINYGTFSYTDLPVEVGPFAGDPSVVYELVASDTNNPDCTDFVIFEGQSCFPIICAIEWLELEVYECTSSGTVDLEFGMFVDNPGNNFWEAWAGDVYLGSFPLNSNGYYSLSQVPVNPGQVVSIEICINDNPNCCSSFSFVPNCSTPTCIIDGLIVDPLGCDPATGTFDVAVNFTHDGTGNEFILSGNGINYGTFSYADLPVVVGPFIGDPTTVYELVATDANNADCTDFTVFEGLNCNTPTCEIYDPVVELTPCSSNGEFFAILDFEYNDINSGQFKVLGANGESYGVFSYADLPIEVGPFDGTLDVLWTLFINDVQYPDCGTEIVFEGPGCGPDPCIVEGLAIELVECIVDGYVNIEFYFEAINPGNEFIDIYINNEFYGYQPINPDNYYVLSQVPTISGTPNILTVCINDNPNCCLEVSFVPDCGVPDCFIGDLVVTPLDCTPSGTFNVLVNFIHEGAGTHFEVSGAAGNSYGIYAYADLPVEIGSFAGDPNVVYDLWVMDTEFPDCQADAWFEGINCGGGDCFIGEIYVEPLDCNSDGTFNVLVDFIHEGIGSHFELKGPNEFSYGIFSYNDLPVEIGPFEGNANAVYDLWVMDTDNPDCQGDTWFEAINCGGGDCQIEYLEIFGSECVNGELFVEFGFGVNNPGNDFYEVWLNGEYQGYYPLNNTNQYYLENAGPVIPGEINTLKVCINDQPNCCIEAVFITDCTNTGVCEISDPFLEFTPCNDLGEYYVWLDFDYTDTNSGEFVVQGNGIVYGYFGYADLPVQIGPFDGNIDPVWELLIADTQYDNCYEEITFTGPGCGGTDCYISDPVIEFLPCTDLGEYFVELYFNHGPGNGDEFKVLGNGQNYGVFDYSQVPITIGPFPAGNDLVWELIVIDVQNDNCQNELVFEGQG
ncbi:MAG: hypothetical protein HKN16_06495, partial [Saprospiraceae bacterium]|nr:hypothetical protein [Saprospiraceae bacterium]